MKQNWQRALATFAMIAAVETPTILTAQGNPPSNPADPNAAPIAPAGIETSPGNGAPRTGASAALAPGRNEVQARYGLPSDARAQEARFRARYGLPPLSGDGGGANPHGGKLEAKLKEIVLDEVKFESLPLSEVLNFLSDESRKRDSEKKGVNFLINPNPPQSVPLAAAPVDPTTGLPMASAAAEPIDMNTVNIRFNMPLRHVTMADVLDAIVRVADHPIQYVVEDYAVIFSLRPEANVSVPMPARAPGPAPLAVRTFHVDTNTFVGGLESAFGIKVETKGKGESQSRKIQTALKDLFAQLNISMEGNKAIFYNELTGTVMVRVAAEDLEVIQAAIETLGGQAMGGYAIGNTMFIPPGR